LTIEVRNNTIDSLRGDIMYAILNGQWEVKIPDNTEVGQILTLQFFNEPKKYIVRIVHGSVAIVELYHFGE
jgi:hypothetical protein